MESNTFSQLEWWKTSIFYQIYPRSFADSNGDGIGDLAGIISRLDYLKQLGVDALWLSPHYPSPQKDCGYDISDYCNVGPEYGNLEDFRRLLKAAHGLGIKVVADLVLNHTSDQHEWFLESASSRDNPKAAWYVWQDTPPNDWQSYFDGSAWTFHAGRDQYYYHYFMKEQPDLNWNNPEVRLEMWKVARFWLDMGVDGFRLDAIATIFEDPALRSHGVKLDLSELRILEFESRNKAAQRVATRACEKMFRYQRMAPGVHDLMKQLRMLIDSYPHEPVLIGEDDSISFMGNGNDELHMVFNFPLMKTDGPFTARHVARNQKERLSALAKLAVPGWQCTAINNHDESRAWTRFSKGCETEAAHRARLSAALLLTLPGTPVLYNGEELGMKDTAIESLAEIRDVLTLWLYDALMSKFGFSAERAFEYAARFTRDCARTPMQWSDSANAGFCPQDVKPWLPVNPDYREGVNAAAQEEDQNSMLNFYRTMILLRKAFPALVAGGYKLIRAGSNDCLVFARGDFGLDWQSQAYAYAMSGKHQAIVVCLNFSPEPVKLGLRRPIVEIATQAKWKHMQRANLAESNPQYTCRHPAERVLSAAASTNLFAVQPLFYHEPKFLEGTGVDKKPPSLIKGVLPGFGILVAGIIMDTKELIVE